LPSGRSNGIPAFSGTYARGLSLEAIMQPYDPLRASWRAHKGCGFRNITLGATVALLAFLCEQSKEPAVYSPWCPMVFNLVTALTSINFCETVHGGNLSHSDASEHENSHFDPRTNPYSAYPPYVVAPWKVVGEVGGSRGFRNISCRYGLL